LPGPNNNAKSEFPRFADANPSILLGSSIPGGSADNIVVGGGLPRAVVNASGVSSIPDVIGSLSYPKLTTVSFRPHVHGV